MRSSENYIHKYNWSLVPS